MGYFAILRGKILLRTPAKLRFAIGTIFAFKIFNTSEEESMDTGGIKTSSENHDDEAQILTDQDLTNETDITELDENLGAKSNSLDDLENEPADFMRGEVDVTEQMERTTRAMEAVLRKKEVPHAER